MSIDTKTVAKIGKLARIEIPAGEREAVAKQLSGILHWIEQLQEVNTDGVEQMTSVSDQKLPWREDKVTDGNCREAVLANAPVREFDCYAVPKVIDGE